MPVPPFSSRRDAGLTFGGVDAGGTKFLCAIGRAPNEIERVVAIKTEAPEETLGKVAAFFNDWIAEGRPLAAIGVSSFGPLCRDPQDADYGKLCNSPKPGWGNADIGGALRRQVPAPLAIDTDVNGAALAEGRWGAAKDIRHFAYVTVGTGVGVGIVADGRLVNGLAHPELGHYRPPRASGDVYKGHCVFHGDCLEGLVCGPAIKERTGSAGEDLPDEHPFWKDFAHYMAHLCSLLLLGFSPERIIIGGGVMNRAVLFSMIREETRKMLGGYLAHPLYARLDDVIAPSGLVIRQNAGDAVNAGALGGFLLAEQAIAATARTSP